MHAFILQDWITIRGAVTTVTQGEDAWLDLTAYQDVVFWLDCREVSGSTTPTITFQTAPTKDESLFTAMATASTLSTTTNPTIVKTTLSGASTLTPIARYLRWQLLGPSGTWDATFRVLVAANSPGM
jgi:hypothetical protein